MSEKPNTPVYVTRPYLPPLEEFIPYLEQMWATRQLTNGGPFHDQFERALEVYLGVKHVSLFANGTLALLTALKALHVSGEVITTPYSFVATAHSLLWNDITPVFVDIDRQTMGIAPEKIEAAITERTTAILPVHVYGYPCDVRKIRAIADRHDLRVIFDAAHAFGVRDEGGSLLRHGNLSVVSFHATKVFTTFEGGAIISPNAEIKRRIDSLKNFGFLNEISVTELGINGKMNEVQAAMGLVQLKHIDAAIEQRRAADQTYRRLLAGVRGVHCPVPPAGIRHHNYSYFPILIGREYSISRDQLFNELRQHNIFARRYFYPLISNFRMYKSADDRKERFPVAADVASRVLCLPIFPGIDEATLALISELIAKHGGTS
ncbi:MAG: DegT/DnrJ/EryC1/StrS family aminotransferase [Rhodocyclales bacterium]|nr:DegT/DnrJ/EryC1/StrS family aminotransferase [Rhodocyclales bacterium]